ncbi:unnamed protein product, partial [Porites evermanni]
TYFCNIIVLRRLIQPYFSFLSRLPYSQREIIPLDKWEILPEQIEFEEEIGRGEFGVVYKATFRKRVGLEVFNTDISKRPLLSTKKAPQVVAVKVLHDDPSKAQKAEFTFEIEQMKLLGSHKNVVSMVGCYTIQEKMSLVIEYVPCVAKEQIKQAEKTQLPVSMEKTPLLQDTSEGTASTSCYLDNETEQFKVTDKELLTSTSVSPGISQASSMSLSIEKDLSDEEENFSTKQLFLFAWQIAKGMNHLAENNLVHRDLAARNVLVGYDNRIKVSDFGLMRQIYDEVSTSAKSKKLPVKWMAPESLYQGVYTTKRGVPYPTLTNSELYRLLGTGYRMERPDMCSDDVYVF